MISVTLALTTLLQAALHQPSQERTAAKSVIVPDFKSVHVGFVEEHSRSLISGFGHLIVCLPTFSVDQADDLLASTALTFTADTGPQGQGFWVGNYKLVACHELIRKYTRFDQRRVTFFELELSEDELRVLRRELIERVSAAYPYDFFRNNCAYYVLEWLTGSPTVVRPKLYLTPRDALSRILRARTFRRKHVIPSSLEILEDRVAECPNIIKRQVRRAIRNPALIFEIEDAESRLLAISVAESGSTAVEHALLQDARRIILDSNAGGGVVARAAIAREQRLGQQDSNDWHLDAEGPSVQAGIVYREGEYSRGLRLSVEGGLRDYHTPPRNTDLLRRIDLLSLTIEVLDDELDLEFILAAIDNQRDLTTLVGGLSNGASIGFTSLTNTDGTEGAFVSTWIGISRRTALGWIGTNVKLVGDELFSSPEAYLLPGVYWSPQFSYCAGYFEARHRHGKSFGVNASCSVSLTTQSEIRVEWTRSPDKVESANVTVVVRF